MKIEIDTQRDSKDELVHLANMLHAISGSHRSMTVKPRELRGVVDKPKDVFGDSSSAPSGGLFSMFGDSSSEQVSAYDPQPTTPEHSQPAQSGTGDIFSIFNSSDTPASQSAEITASTLLDEEDKETSSAKDILDATDIVPY